MTIILPLVMMLVFFYVIAQVEKRYGYKVAFVWALSGLIILFVCIEVFL